MAMNCLCERMRTGFFSFILVCLAGLSLLLAHIPAVAQGATHKQLMDRLVAAYPAFLKEHDGKDIIWRDGTKMRFDDGERKTPAERLEKADLEDQFFDVYTPGPLLKQPPRDYDPGRARHEPFFVKMYGDCRKGEVTKHFTDVVWLPRNWGKRIQFTTVNGAAEQLRQVSEELDKLPPRFMPFLKPDIGTYNCRPIAQTSRYSMHAFGAAVDLNPAYGDYWLWGRKDKNGAVAYKNRIPIEIVEIFERHGFIWGGKWYHYDTFHFEYRPELLNSGFTAAQQDRPAPQQQDTTSRSGPSAGPYEQTQTEELRRPAAPDEAPVPGKQPRQIPR